MTASLDYSAYTKLLDEFVDEHGMVDYAELKNNREALDTLVGVMGAITEETYSGWTTNEQLAFWINAYNAITLRAIVDNYPIQKGGLIKRNLYPANSIRQIDGVWKKMKTVVVGEEITLDDIEHQVLRKQFDEPKMHFAIVCASISCPSLRTEAYEGEKLAEQLDDQTRGFMSDPGKFKLDSDSKTIHLSPIFDWFDEDFTSQYNLDGMILGRSKRLGAVLDFVRQHLPEEDAGSLSNADFKVKYLDYDWSLNEQQ